jgi:hypothetical protein
VVVVAVDGPVSLATVDTLARLRLAARRVGIELLLAEAQADLETLVRFAGLQGVLPTCLSVEVVRKPEAGEQPGVEVVVVVPDSPT